MEKQGKDVKKNTSIITWLLLIIFVIIIAVVVDTTSKTEPRVTTNAETIDILVTSQNVKQIDGKYRYFFNIKNNDSKSFTGDVNIDLINAEGDSVYDKTFSSSQTMISGGGTSVYFDINTGPTSVHGANGIKTFSFTAKVSGQTVKSGSGSISVGSE